MICKLHYHSLSSPPTPDGSGWWRNFHKEYYNSRTFRNQFLETSNAETNFGTNYIKHYATWREKNCNYCQKKHLNEKWLNITAAITTSKKIVTDFCGTLD